MEFSDTLGRCALCGSSLNPIDYDSDFNRCIPCKTNIGTMEISDYRNYLKKSRKKPTFVFFFEILQFSDFGEWLKLFYALETKTHLTTDENKLP